MADKPPMEVQIKDQEKTMLTIVRAMKDLKASVKALEEKGNKSQNEDIPEIVKSQKILEEIITLTLMPSRK